MEQVKYLILGAGPAGLALAVSLKEKGESSFLVLEKEMTAGGLCRSRLVDGAPLDIGGGHFLDVRRPKVNDFLFRFMPKEEWTLFERDSRIAVKGMLISHPFEANIWQMELEQQIAYLLSVAKAGCNNGSPKPEKFVDWIRWKLGDRIAEDYMLPYNRKMFADELNELGTYWLEKLPDVSFEETLRSCLTHKPHGTQPGHASFYYPREHGYGEVWLRLADTIKEHIIYGQEAEKLDCDSRQVTGKNGEKYQAQYIITTVPWAGFQEIQGMTAELAKDAAELKSSAVEIRYIPEKLDTKAQWIYVPDEEIPCHRILVRHNFCKEGNGYWMETRKERVGNRQEKGSFSYLNEYAYPLNTIGKPEKMQRLLAFCRSRQIYGLGRWGEHAHYNSDFVVEQAMNLAKQL